MNTTTLIADYPAYSIHRMPAQRQAKMIDGTEFAMPFESINHGTMYHFFQIGSVAGYAVRNGDDPIAEIERAKGFGHDLHYVFALSTCIHNGPKTKETKYALNWGDVIGFEGRQFRLDRAPNNNVRLVDVTSA